MMAIRLHGGFKRFDALGPTHKKRDHHVRKNNHVAQRQQRQIDRGGRQWGMTRHWETFSLPVKYGSSTRIYNPRMIIDRLRAPQI